MGLDTAVDELSVLAERIEGLAQAKGLTLVPATPTTGGGATVHLEAEDVSLEDFFDLAVAAGQKLAYIEPKPFDVGITELNELAATDLDEELRRKVIALQETTARFVGWPTSLEAAFVYEGVVHRWFAVAQWHEELQDTVDALLPSEEEPAAELSDDEAEALVEQLATELLALPEFRAGNENERRRVARLHHACVGQASDRPGRQTGWLLRRAIDRALDTAASEQQRLYAGTEQRIPELVKVISADPAYRAASTAAARKIHVQDYLMSQADGYPPPARVFELLLDALKASQAPRPEPTPMLPLMPD